MKPRKNRLTRDERLTAAFFHLVRGWEQQVIAEFYGVNIGRVNEAVKAIEIALDTMEEKGRKRLAKPSQRLMLVHRRG